jgi:hypothetical protein
MAGTATDEWFMDRGAEEVTMKMHIEFTWEGNIIRATGDYEPGLPAQTYGPPERCYPEEPPEFAFDTCQVLDAPNVWLDATWILGTSVGDDWHALACEAAEAQLEEDRHNAGDADYEAWLDRMDERDWK